MLKTCYDKKLSFQILKRKTVWGKNNIGRWERFENPYFKNMAFASESVSIIYNLNLFFKTEFQI